MKLQALSHPVMPVAFPNHLIFTSLINYFHFSAFTYTLIAVLMIVLQALYLNMITERHKLQNKVTYYPAFMYVLLTSLYPAFNYFSEPLLINWFLLLALDIMLSFPKTLYPRKQIFNAGFAISVPFIIQFPAIGFVVLALVALFLLRSYSTSELVVLLLGYLTPVYFFLGILYLFDKLTPAKFLPEIGFDLHALSASRIYLAGTIAGVGMMLLTGSYALQQLNSKMIIYVRRSWILIFCYLLIAATVTLFAVSAVHAEWILILPPVCLIASCVYFQENNKRLSTFMFYFSLALLIFSQITFK